MLKALYDYAIRNDLVLPAGYVNKTVKAYILIYADGTFQDIELGDGEAIPAPDIGSLANGKDKSNVLLEKRSVVIPGEPSAKSAFFLSALKDGAKVEPLLAVCAAALENQETAAAIRLRLDEKKIKDSDRITFKVDNRSILECENVQTWWQEFRKQFAKKDSAERQRCLISGELTVPMATTPAISGLYAVGGHARGDALICFDKSAFCSYDLKQAANAPVSEDAFAAVKAALDHLLKKAPTLAGMKVVHWYDCDVPRQEDPLVQMGDFGFPGIELEEADEDWEEEDWETGAEPADAWDKEAELEAIRSADALIKSVNSGVQALIPDNASYFILLLTGVGGRVMIRRYERGSYRELKEKLTLWREDLALTNGAGTGNLKSCKLAARMLRLLKYQKTDSRPFERLEKEMAGMTSAVISAILSGGALPDAVAARALAYIRSEMLSADEETANALFVRDAAVWQWLKVWLLRNKGKRGMLMCAYNPNYVSNAYHCGAMMAVYEAIQKAAMPEVNASVAQRYYASAIQTPALVFGRLSVMSTYHLNKIENAWLANKLKEQLAEINDHVEGSIPVTLNLEGQSEFALGYYQMTAELVRRRIEYNAAKKAAEQKERER